MSTFTLLVDLKAFTGEDREGIDVTVRADPRSYPVAGETTYVGSTTRKTNADGDVEFTLLAREGLTYVVSSPAFNPRRISGDRLPDVVVRFDEAVSVQPSPIQPVDAATLRAEHNADVALINAAIAALQAESGQGITVHRVYFDGDQYFDQNTDTVIDPAVMDQPGAVTYLDGTTLIIVDSDGAKIEVDLPASFIDSVGEWFGGDGREGLPAGQYDVRVQHFFDGGNSLELVEHVDGGGGGGGPITGNGFPEGVVTAPVGTEYVDQSATNGAVKWIKASGIGNTGWKVVYGDTGWRDIAGLADTVKITSIEPSGFKVRRVNENVMVYFAGKLTAQGQVTLTALPSGFGRMAPDTRVGTGYSGTRAWVLSNGHVSITGAITNNSTVNFFADESLTADLWPISLPGIPA